MITAGKEMYVIGDLDWVQHQNKCAPTLHRLGIKAKVQDAGEKSTVILRIKAVLSAVCKQKELKGDLFIT